MDSIKKTNNHAAPQLNRTLTLFPLVFMGLAYMSPMAVFSPYGIVAQGTQGRAAAAYLVALIMVLFTAYSYGKMVKAFPSSGSAYTYASKTINPSVGFLVGWAVLTDYIFLPVLNILASGIFIHAIFPQIPLWAGMLLLLGTVTIVNMFGVKLNAKVNTLVVLFQFLVVAFFAGFAIQRIQTGMGTGELFSTLPFYNPEHSFSFVLAGASIVCTSFLGFDAVTTFTEETVNPRKTVPRAILLIALIGGAMFIGLSYLLHMVYPDFGSFKDPEAGGYEIVYFLGSAFLTSFFTAGFIIASIGMSLTSHASGARLLYVMGRDGVLPKKIFGYIHPKLMTPLRNVLIIAVICLLGFFIDLETAFSLVNFGALLAFTFVNLSVIAHYFIKEKRRGIKNFLLYLALPLTGAGFNIWILANLSKNALSLGSIWVAVGVAYLLYLTKFFTKQPPHMNFNEAEYLDSNKDIEKLS